MVVQTRSRKAAASQPMEAPSPEAKTEVKKPKAKTTRPTPSAAEKKQQTPKKTPATSKTKKTLPKQPTSSPIEHVETPPKPVRRTKAANTNGQDSVTLTGKQAHSRKKKKKKKKKELLDEVDVPTTSGLVEDESRTVPLYLFEGIQRFQGRNPADLMGWMEFFDPITCHLQDLRQLVFNVVRLLDGIFFSMMNSYAFHCGDDGGGAGIDRVDFMTTVFSWPRETLIDLLATDIDFRANFDFVFGEWNEDFLRSVHFQNLSGEERPSRPGRSLEVVIAVRNEYVWNMPLSTSPEHFHRPEIWGISMAEVARLGEIGQKLLRFYTFPEPRDAWTGLTLQELRFLENVWCTLEANPIKPWRSLAVDEDSVVGGREGDDWPCIKFEPKKLPSLSKKEQNLARKRHKNMYRTRLIARGHHPDLFEGEAGSPLEGFMSCTSELHAEPAITNGAASQKTKGKRSPDRHAPYVDDGEESDSADEHESVSAAEVRDLTLGKHPSRKMKSRYRKTVDAPYNPESDAWEVTESESEDGAAKYAKRWGRNFRGDMEDMLKKQDLELTEEHYRELKKAYSELYDFDGDFALKKGFKPASDVQRRVNAVPTVVDPFCGKDLKLTLEDLADVQGRVFEEGLVKRVRERLQDLYDFDRMGDIQFPKLDSDDDSDEEDPRSFTSITPRFTAIPHPFTTKRVRLDEARTRIEEEIAALQPKYKLASSQTRCQVVFQGQSFDEVWKQRQQYLRDWEAWKERGRYRRPISTQIPKPTWLSLFETKIRAFGDRFELLDLHTIRYETRKFTRHLEAPANEAEESPNTLKTTSEREERQTTADDHAVDIWDMTHAQLVNQFLKQRDSYYRDWKAWKRRGQYSTRISKQNPNPQWLRRFERYLKQAGFRLEDMDKDDMKRELRRQFRPQVTLKGDAKENISELSATELQRRKRQVDADMDRTRGKESYVPMRSEPDSDSDVASDVSMRETTPIGFSRHYRQPTVESDPDETATKPSSEVPNRSTQAKAADVIPSGKQLNEDTAVKGILGLIGAHGDAIASDLSKPVDVLGLKPSTAGHNGNSGVLSSGALSTQAVYNLTIACHQLRAKLLHTDWRSPFIEQLDFRTLIESGYRKIRKPTYDLMFRNDESTFNDGGGRGRYRLLNTEEFELLEELVENGRESCTDPEEDLATRFTKSRIRKLLRSWTKGEWVTTETLCIMVNEISDYDVSGSLDSWIDHDLIYDIARHLAMTGKLGWRSHPFDSRGSWGAPTGVPPQRMLWWDLDRLQYEYTWLVMSDKPQKPEDDSWFFDEVSQKKEPVGPAIPPVWVDILPDAIRDDPDSFSQQTKLARNLFSCLAYRFGQLIRRLENTLVERLSEVVKGKLTHLTRHEYLLSSINSIHCSQISEDKRDTDRHMFNNSPFWLFVWRDPEELDRIWPIQARSNWTPDDWFEAGSELNELERLRLAYVPVQSNPLKNPHILGALQTVNRAMVWKKWDPWANSRKEGDTSARTKKKSKRRWVDRWHAPEWMDLIRPVCPDCGARLSTNKRIAAKHECNAARSQGSLFELPKDPVAALDDGDGVIWPKKKKVTSASSNYLDSQALANKSSAITSGNLFDSSYRKRLEKHMHQQAKGYPKDAESVSLADMQTTGEYFFPGRTEWWDGDGPGERREWEKELQNATGGKFKGGFGSYPRIESHVRPIPSVDPPKSPTRAKGKQQASDSGFFGSSASRQFVDTPEHAQRVNAAARLRDSVARGRAERPSTRWSSAAEAGTTTSTPGSFRTWFSKYDKSPAGQNFYQSNAGQGHWNDAGPSRSRYADLDKDPACRHHYQSNFTDSRSGLFRGRSSDADRAPAGEAPPQDNAGQRQCDARAVMQNAKAVMEQAKALMATQNLSPGNSKMSRGQPPAAWDTILQDHSENLFDNLPRAAENPAAFVESAMAGMKRKLGLTDFGDPERTPKEARTEARAGMPGGSAAGPSREASMPPEDESIFYPSTDPPPYSSMPPEQK